MNLTPARDDAGCQVDDQTLILVTAPVMPKAVPHNKCAKIIILNIIKIYLFIKTMFLRLNDKIERINVWSST